MKQTRQMDLVQLNMAPGIITLSGFMGSDSRTLTEIISGDDSLVKRTGFSHNQLAARMRELRNRAPLESDELSEVPPHYQVKVEDFRGRLPCPFGDGVSCGKTSITVRNRVKNRDITYTDLSIHLIEAHGFYQGRGSAFRIEPEEIVDILDLSPGHEQRDTAPE